MSQYPPNPPGNMPPGAYPPYGGAYPAAQPRTSAAAIAALVLGLLMCVPIVTGLAAIICGAVGISATGKPGVKGRGMAIAGLVLGVLGILLWCGGLARFGMMMSQTAPDRAVATAFVGNLATGNVTAAQAQCAGTVSPVSLAAAATQLQAIGTYTSYKPIISVLVGPSGSRLCVVTGMATFGNNPHNIVITLQHPTGGTPLVESWQIQ